MGDGKWQWQWQWHCILDIGNAKSLALPFSLFLGPATQGLPQLQRKKQRIPAPHSKKKPKTILTCDHFYFTSQFFYFSLLRVLQNTFVGR